MPEIFISYKWGGESEAIANEVHAALEAAWLTVVIDKKDTGYKADIKAFEERIGRGDFIVPIISAGYLKSKHCMHEMFCINNRGNIWNRIFPIVLDDAGIFDDDIQVDYIDYWENKHRNLEKSLKRRVEKLSGTGTIIDKITLYDKIRLFVGEITDILEKMNTLTKELHRKSGFKELTEAIKRQIAATAPHLIDTSKSCIPSLLVPYLGDRLRQKHMFTEFIKNLRSGNTFRPLLAFLSGPDDECHDRFIDRLRLEILPSLPEFESDECLAQEKKVDWPTFSRGDSTDSRYQRFLQEVIMGLHGEGAGEEGVRTAIMQWLPTTICIRHNMLYTEWNRNEENLICRVAAMWNSVSKQIVGKRLFLFFCIKYNSREHGFFWSKPVAGQVERFVGDFSFVQYENLFGMAFPSLHSPEFLELDAYMEEWGEKIAGSVHKFKKQVGDLYSITHRKKAIPMQTLGLAIEEILDSHHSPRKQ